MQHTHDEWPGQCQTTVDFWLEFDSLPASATLGSPINYVHTEDLRWTAGRPSDPDLSTLFRPSAQRTASTTISMSDDLTIPHWYLTISMFDDWTVPLSSVSEVFELDSVVTTEREVSKAPSYFEYFH